MRALILPSVIASLATGAASIADTAGSPPPVEFTQLKEASGRDITVGRCIICHGLEYIPGNAPAMNRAGWEKSIQKMRERFGAPITDQEARQILDYLAANYSDKT